MKAKSWPQNFDVNDSKFTTHLQLIEKHFSKTIYILHAYSGNNELSFSCHSVISQAINQYIYIICVSKGAWSPATRDLSSLLIVSPIHISTTMNLCFNSSKRSHHIIKYFTLIINNTPFWERFSLIIRGFLIIFENFRYV